MRKRLYVENLSTKKTAWELNELLAKKDEINTVRIAVNRGTHPSDGVGFVEMEHGGEAIAVFDGKNLKRRVLTVPGAGRSLSIVIAAKASF